MTWPYSTPEEYTYVAFSQVESGAVCVVCGSPVAIREDGKAPVAFRRHVTAIDVVDGVEFEDDWWTEETGPVCPQHEEELF